MFVGTVLDVTDLPRTDRFAFLSNRKARIRVDESFGGLASDAHDVDVLTGSGGGDCGVPFRTGEVYLISAGLGDDGLLHAGICSATRKIEFAEAVVRVLRQQRDHQPVPTLIGGIAQYNRNFEGLLGMHAPIPLPNTLMRLKADGRVYETQSDSQGLYAFYNLPSGKYEFAPDLPAGTTLSWFIGSDKPVVPFEVHVGACQERNVEAFPSGSIQGRVLDSSGNLIREAFVYIVPVDKNVIPAERQLYWEFQGKESFFKFVHLPPGQYLLVVNPDDAQDPKFPYPRTFYPGGSDRASAKVVTISGGEHVTDADIHLKQKFAPRRVTVRVTWADGRLIRDLVFVEAKGVDRPAVMADAKQPDLKSSVVELTLVAGEAYRIEARLTCRYADEQSVGPGASLHSEGAYLGAKDERAELSLAIPANACPEVQGKTLVTGK
ncbi:MAG TPA: hypothetical protein VMT15_14635 [Bryobacteraceae bacterium]|nr:hypothetical protein [Bryobacteraceae bacterium]